MKMQNQKENHLGSLAVAKQIEQKHQEREYRVENKRQDYHYRDKGQKNLVCLFQIHGVRLLIANRTVSKWRQTSPAGGRPPSCAPRWRGG